MVSAASTTATHPCPARPDHHHHWHLVGRAVHTRNPVLLLIVARVLWTARPPARPALGAEGDDGRTGRPDDLRCPLAVPWPAPSPHRHRWCRYDPASPCRARTAGWSGRRVLAVLVMASRLDVMSSGVVKPCLMSQVWSPAVVRSFRTSFRPLPSVSRFGR